MTNSIFNDISAKTAFTAPPVTNANSKVEMTVDNAISAATQTSTPTDTFEVSSKPKKEKKGLFKSVNGAISNFKKFWASAEAYTMAGAKGIGKGAILGALVFTGGSIIDFAKNNKAIKHPIAIAVAAGATAVTTFVATMWRAGLDLNEKKSEIEHRYEGHKQ